MNRDRVVADAKETALGLVRGGYRPARLRGKRVRGRRRLKCWASNF